MTQVKPPWLPYDPTLAAFHEAKARTLVDDKPRATVIEALTMAAESARALEELEIEDLAKLGHATMSRAMGMPYPWDDVASATKMAWLGVARELRKRVLSQQIPVQDERGKRRKGKRAGRR